MKKGLSSAQLATLDNWEINPDPRQIQGISKRIEEINTANFFSKKKKKWFTLWSFFFILIVFVVIKLLLGVSLFDFAWKLRMASKVPYFTATLLFGASTFFVCEVFVRVAVINLKLRKFIKNVGLFEWFRFSVISFLIQSITPFSIGSEPYTIWWLRRRGVPVRDATAVTAVSTICWFMSQFLVTWPSFIYLTVNNWSKVSSLSISPSYWLVLVGLTVDILVFLFIFVISYVNKAHFFISKYTNEIKRYFGFQHLTRDELFQKYFVESTFKNTYVKYLFRKSTLQVLALYLMSNVWVYATFAMSHRLFLSSVYGTSYWDPATSALNSYNLINVATTSNNFFPLPSAEGSLQATLQSLMTDISSVNSSSVNSSSIQSNDLKAVNDSTIFLWRIFYKYIGLTLALIFIFIFGFNPSAEVSKKNWKSNRAKYQKESNQTPVELVF